MKRNIILGLLSLFVLGIVAAGAASAFGFGLWHSAEDREEIREAAKNRDFAAWKSAIQSKLTEENFNQIIEMHDAMSKRWALHDEMRSAIEAGDYDAYVSAASSMTEAEPVSEEDFNTLVELHEARQSGDYEKARELRKELGPNAGIGMGPGIGNGMGHHFGKGRV